jgi:hypothetical protein
MTAVLGTTAASPALVGAPTETPSATRAPHNFAHATH